MKMFYLPLAISIILAASPASGATGPSSTLEKVNPVTAPRLPTAIIAPIDAQLREFRNGQIENAYNNTTSEEFRSATSLESFKAFVENNPLLTKHKNIELQIGTTQPTEASITVILDPGKDSIPVSYRLIRENDKWKIWHMSVAPLYSKQIRTLMKDTDAMHKPIEEQLKALQEGNIPRAYQNYTSETFRRATSLDAFRHYISDFPILIQKVELEFTDPAFDKGTSLLEARLNTDTSTTVIEYTLGIEDDEWKIWGMKVLKQLAKAPSTASEGVGEPSVRVTQTKQADDEIASPAAPMEFSRIEIGGKTSMQEAGSTNILKSNQGDIHVNLFIRRGVFGSKIELQMLHLESRTKIPSISTTLQQDGNLVVSFVFSPPLSGWPQGHYLLTATSSTGAKRVQEFRVE